mmetsp:Transcript_58928/g.117083  ORF Transcript_58928/g.117083 Transcript_58928/m.117083 type:complete len:176 (-) Transcript_58928:299-826(-)
MLRRAEERQRTSNEMKVGEQQWSVPLALPQQSFEAATQRMPSIKTVRLLRSLTSLWHLWRVRCVDSAGEVADRAPLWKQLQDFIEFAAHTRRNRSLLEEGRLGAGEDQLELYVIMLFKHVLPTLYPQMVDPTKGGMGNGRYRALKNDAVSAVKAMFIYAGSNQCSGLGSRRAEDD